MMYVSKILSNRPHLERHINAIRLEDYGNDPRLTWWEFEGFQANAAHRSTGLFVGSLKKPKYWKDLDGVDGCSGQMPLGCAGELMVVNTMDYHGHWPHGFDIPNQSYCSLLFPPLKTRLTPSPDDGTMAAVVEPLEPIAEQPGCKALRKRRLPLQGPIWGDRQEVEPLLTVGHDNKMLCFR